MHYVPKNYQNGLGLVGPTRQVNGGGGYTTTGGAFTARRIYTPPRPMPTPLPVAATPTLMPTSAVPVTPRAGVLLPYYDPARTFTYTREQIQQMQDAAIAARGELLDRQGREGGDGIYDDLEQKAAEENATEKAIADAAAAMGIPPPADAGSTRAAQNVFPLVLAAAAAFFFLM